MSLIINGYEYIKMPAGTTAQRPVTPLQGMQRYNTTLGYTEVYNGVGWVGMGTQGTAPRGMQVFTSGGTFTIPANVTSVKVTAVGGGGGGGGATDPGSSITNYGGGGGGGGNCISLLTNLIPGNTLSITIGSGGAAGNNGGGAGGSGSASTVASGTQTITTITAGGGAGGSSGSGGVGGTATNGTFNIAGQVGSFSTGGNTLFGFGSGTQGVAGGLYGGGGRAGTATNNFVVQYTAATAGAAGVVVFEW
jgi:hypothetical protein